MNNELLNIKLSDKGTIKSTELVEIINTFREIEGRKNLLHKSFMEKIRKELETLVSLGLKAEQNILPSKYKDSTGKTNPCYELNREGMLQMLNSESALVRFKTIEYIGKLEKEVQFLKEENQRIVLESKDRTILRLESENKKINKILQADNYISSEMYGEPTYITSIVINILKKCGSKKKNIMYINECSYFINLEPVKEEYKKYKIKDSEFKRYIEYFSGCQTTIRLKNKSGYSVLVKCYSVPKFIIDWDIKESLKRIS